MPWRRKSSAVQLSWSGHRSFRRLLLALSAIYCCPTRSKRAILVSQPLGNLVIIG